VRATENCIDATEGVPMKTIILFLALTLPAIGFAKDQSILKKVQATAEFQKISKSYEQYGGYFNCSEVNEVLVSKNYSSLQDAQSRYSLAILTCQANPNDGGDAIQAVGLATLNSSGQVLSFTVEHPAQPD